MSPMGRVLRWFGIALGLLILVLAAAFGGLQTGPGRNWLAGAVAHMASDPDFRVSISGLDGLVPFHMTAQEIAVADRNGIYMTAQDVALDIIPAALLRGRVDIRSLTIGTFVKKRPSTAPSKPLIDYLQVPHLPVAVALDHLGIGRLVLEPPVLGEQVVASLTGSGTTAAGQARLDIDLHRIDGQQGHLELAMALAGTAPTLSLHLEASEPSGLLLDRLLGRTDRRPLSVALNGSGPLSDWHGRLGVTAGAGVDVEATLGLAMTGATGVTASGTAALVPLLPAKFAPIVGGNVPFALDLSNSDQQTLLKHLSLQIAAGRLTASADLGKTAIAARLQAQFPDLSRLSALAGEPVRGSLDLLADIGGTRARPKLTARISAERVELRGSGADRVAVRLSAAPNSDLGEPRTEIAVSANGRVEGLALPASAALPPALGRDIAWSLEAAARRDFSRVEIKGLSVAGAGVSLTGSGQYAQNGPTSGRFNLKIADLRPFAGLVGKPIAGALTLKAEAQQQGGAGIAGRIDAAATGFGTGNAAADALLGGTLTLTGSLRRTDAGEITIDRLALAGADLTMTGSGHYDPTSGQLAAAAGAAVPRLAPVGNIFGHRAEGRLTAQVDLGGTLARLRLDGAVAGTDLVADGTRIDRLRLDAHSADLSARRAGIDGSFAALGIDGQMALAVALGPGSELDLPSFRISAAGSTIDGRMRVALDTGLVQGSIRGRIPELARWSRLARTPLAGSLDLSAGLDASRGQKLELAIGGSRLRVGSGSSRIAIGRLGLDAQLADLTGKPTGSGRLTLAAVHFGKGAFRNAALSFDSPRPGRFAFRGNADGEPLTLAFAGDAATEPGGATLRLASLGGSLDGQHFRLTRPLSLSRRGADVGFSGLALAIGSGRIGGNGGLRGERVALDLRGTDLPLAAGGRLFGHSDLQGTLGFSINAGGSLAAPHGRLTVNARGVGFAVPGKRPQARLGIAADGGWDGRRLALDGRVTGLSGTRVRFSGSGPLVLRRNPFGIAVPPEGRLALRVEGGGRLEHLADLLPLGEDRLSGRFAADLSIDGTVAAPAAGGRLTLSEARYQNFASGAVLTGISAVVTGNRNRVDLVSFSAGDSASGKASARGTVAIGGVGAPRLDLSARLADFRIAALDEAVATASGRITITGPLTAPTVTAPLTIERAEVNLPDSLPPSVVVLNVVEKGGGAAPPPAPRPPALPAALDLTVDMPGQVFVRGHGLDSVWRGRLRITGTSSAPRIAGTLTEIRGSFALLGKTFRLTHGEIRFDGSPKLDPALDIGAEIATADITAQIAIGGTASAPTITLSSEPALPRDEILSRILFNQGLGRINAAQGLQLAQAAAALSGHNLGVLDKVRTSLGLDWLGFGQGPLGAAPSVVNPSAAAAANTSATNGTALSAGKYVAQGVSIGVTQGVSPPTSKVVVEIQLGHHLTVDTETGQDTGTGIGLNYSYDY